VVDVYTVNQLEKCMDGTALWPFEKYDCNLKRQLGEFIMLGASEAKPKFITVLN